MAMPTCGGAIGSTMQRGGSERRASSQNSGGTPSSPMSAMREFLKKSIYFLQRALPIALTSVNRIFPKHTSLIQRHSPLRPDRLLDSKGRLRNLDQFGKWDRSLLPVFHRIYGQLKFPAMALILFALHCLCFAAAGKVNRLEIINACDTVSAKHFEIFLGNRSISIGHIHQVRHRAVRKGNRNRDVIAVVAPRIRQGRSRQSLHGAPHHSSCRIDKMTQLTHDPAAALGLLNPILPSNKPSVAADMYQHRLGASGEKACHFFRKRGEAAIKSHHEEGRPFS